MKDSKKHRIFVQAALVLFVLAGCSSVKSTKEPSMTSADRSVGYPSVRSNSVWTSSIMVKEPIPQGVQGHVLQANNVLDTESARQSQSSKRVTRRPEGAKVASQRGAEGSVGDALDKVLGGRSTTKEPTVMNTVGEVITTTEIPGNENTNKESPTK